MKNLLHKLLLTTLLAGSLAFVHAAETITYFHNDALGSPVAATDESGNVLWREAYKPYGSRIRKEDNGTNDTWYTGKQEDKATGLSYFGARWYDPVIGRFMGIDPVGFKEGNIHSFNRYAYVSNNPYKFVDPDGRAQRGISYKYINLGGGGGGACCGGFSGGHKQLRWGGAVNKSKDVVNGVKSTVKIGKGSSQNVTKSVGKEPNRIYSARELKRRAEDPRTNNTANPNHNFPESFNAEIFKGNRIFVSDKYHVYTRGGTLNGRAGVYEIGVKPSASGSTEVITHRFFNPNKK